MTLFEIWFGSLKMLGGDSAIVHRMAKAIGHEMTDMITPLNSGNRNERIHNSGNNSCASRMALAERIRERNVLSFFRWFRFLFSQQ
jgi:hypothetical protein